MPPSGCPVTTRRPWLALGALLDYLHDTQKTDLEHVDRLDYYRQGQFMELDLTARRNLELTETLRGKEKKGSLLWVLDKTKTAMGARLLRSWLERPLLSVSAIARRSDAVAALVKHTVQREELILALTGIGDMERLMGRIVYGSAGGRDMVSLKNAMDHLPGHSPAAGRLRGRTPAGAGRTAGPAGGSGRGHRQDFARRSPLLRAGGRVHPGRL